ncbi:MFS transporter [Caldivirga sp.]|uniref:MFS transporter n=1 Tax=Caldivirga sp. TaxID=2080243 RepID=UPI0025C44959|nr:MFS transporter [Caldivirga sp.]
MISEGLRKSKLFQVNTLYSAAGGLYYPAIPLYLRGLGVSVDLISLILSGLSLSGFISAVLWGKLADSPSRRRRIIAVTTIGGAVFYMILALPLPLTIFTIILFLANLMAPGAVPVIMAEASGWVNATEEMGYFWIGGSLGYSLTTAFTGLILEKVGVGLIFLLSSVLILGVYAVSRGIIFSDRKEPAEATRVTQGNGISMIFWLLMLSVTIFLFTDVAKNLYIPVFYAFNLRMGYALATLTLSIEALLEIPVIYVFTKMLSRINAWLIFSLSLILAGLFFLLNAIIPPDPVYAFLVMSSYALVWGTYSVSSTELVAMLTDLRRRGTAYGVYNSAFPVANIIGPLYIGYVISISGYRRGLIYLSMPVLALGVMILKYNGKAKPRLK